MGVLLNFGATADDERYGNVLVSDFLWAPLCLLASDVRESLSADVRRALFRYQQFANRPLEHFFFFFCHLFPTTTLVLSGVVEER